MPTNAEVAKTYLAGVLAKLPDHLRAQAETAFNDANAAAALDELGQGVKRQEDYSRSMDSARAEMTRATEAYNQNQVWYQANLAEIQAAASMRARLAELEKGNGTGGPPEDLNRPPATGLEDRFVPIERFQQTVDESLALFLVVGPQIRDRHRALFGEEVPMAELVAEARQKQLTLEQMYNQRYAAQLKAKSEEADAARIKRIEDEAIARYRRENPQMPYPSPRAQTGSPLDGIKPGAPVEPAANLVADSVAMYDELVAQKSGG